MTKRILTTMSILLTMVVYAAGVYANNTVLQLVPKDSVGFVYISNPMRLSQKIDDLASDMADSPQHNLLAKIFADTLDADFQSLDELQDVGFDLEKDLCILFYDAVSEKDIAVIAHVNDSDGVEALLQEESSPPMEEYKILDDLFVTGSKEICKKVTDTYEKKNRSILQSSDYKSLKMDLSEKNEIALFVNIDKIVQTYSSEVQKLRDEAKSALEEVAQDKQQRGSEVMGKLMLNFGLWLFDQLDLYCLTANLEGSTAQFTDFVKFKDESEIQKYISTEPTELNLLGLLPHSSFVVGSGIFRKEDWIDLFKTAFDITQEDVETDSQAYEEFSEKLEEFYTHFGEEFAFAVDMSTSVVPDLLYIFETEDEKSLSEYMKTGYLEYLKIVSDLRFPIAMVGTNAMAGATPGESEIYYDVEIQCIDLPNMEKAFANTNIPEEMKPLTPKKWSIWYTIKDGKMILAMSGSSEPIKQTLDAMNGDVGNIKSDRNYDKLTRSIAADNNFVAYFSPVMLVKKVATLVSQTNPDIGGMVALMFASLPDTYNIAISGINRDKGIEVNTIVALDDLKQVIQMLVAISQQR